MARALFVCLHNAGRSQMSEALFTLAAGGRHEARSAGTTPGERVHPEVVEVMAELGIDLAGRTPRKLTRGDAEWADVVVTMGCGDECPYIPGKRYLEWDLPDPKGQPIDAVRVTREEIARRVEALVADLDAPGPAVGQELPVVCSLDPGDLEKRLTEIAAVGAASLVGRTVEGDRHLLRFRSDAATRSRLEAIVAAEAKCCSFLELSLAERGDELVLSIGAPEAGKAASEGLAAAFAGSQPG